MYGKMQESDIAEVIHLMCTLAIRDSLGGSVEKEMAIHSSILAWRIHGWRSRVGYSLQGRRESDMTEQLHFTSSGSDGKESACSAGDPGLIPGSERSLGEQNGNTLQYSCLENSMDRGAWCVTVHGVTKSQTQLSD